MSSRAFLFVIAEAIRNPIRRSGSVPHLYPRCALRASHFRQTCRTGEPEPPGTAHAASGLDRSAERHGIHLETVVAGQRDGLELLRRVRRHGRAEELDRRPVDARHHP